MRINLYLPVVMDEDDVDLVSVSEGAGDETMNIGGTAQTGARIHVPKMAAEPHTWVTIPPRSFTRLYVWHAHCGHAGTLTPLSTRHQLL
jgi:hypothetical protein